KPTLHVFAVGTFRAVARGGTEPKQLERPMARISERRRRPRLRAGLAREVADERRADRTAPRQTLAHDVEHARPHGERKLTGGGASGRLLRPSARRRVGEKFRLWKTSISASSTFLLCRRSLRSQFADVRLLEVERSLRARPSTPLHVLAEGGAQGGRRVDDRL